MWTVGPPKKDRLGFMVECHDWNGDLFFSGEYPTYGEAIVAAESAERRMTLDMMSGKIDCDLTDEELLAELMP